MKKFKIGDANRHHIVHISKINANVCGLRFGVALVNSCVARATYPVTDVVGVKGRGHHIFPLQESLRSINATVKREYRFA